MKFKWLNKNIFFMGLTSFFSDFSHEITTAALPTLMVNLVGSSLAPQLLGIISGLSDAASGLVKVFSGWISDKTNKRKGLIVLGYGITGIFSGLIGTATTWIEILLYRTVAWTGRGLREAPRDALIADSTSSMHYGKAFGFHRAMDTLGAIAGPLFVFLALSHIDVKKIIYFSFIPGILAVFTIALFTKDKVKIKIKHKTLGFWKDIASLPKNFRYFLFVMFIFGIGNFNRTLLLLRTQNILEPSMGLIIAGSLSVLLYSLRNFIQAIADYLIGYLSDIFGRKFLLAFFGFFLFGVMSLGFAFPIPSLWFFTLLFILSGISAAASTSLEKAYAADLLPIHLRGTGYGVLQSINGLGDFLSSFIVGILWSTISPIVGFFYSAIFCFTSTLLLLKTKK